MSVNPKRKPCDKPAVYNQPVKQQKITKDTPRTFSAFEGGDSSIADTVRHEIAIANGEVIKVDSDEDDDDDEVDPSITRKDILDLCQQLEVGCMQYGDPQFSLDLSSQLRKFCVNLQHEELLNARQTS
ncbi:hypothetical protein DFH29DRAFT_876055 [Suillus ampliporus]|nr:hypothetical protein DFH29DRAFT_876055 [Suillus ampliporus]